MRRTAEQQQQQRQVVSATVSTAAGTSPSRSAIVPVAEASHRRAIYYAIDLKIMLCNSPVGRGNENKPTVPMHVVRGD